MRKLKAVLFLSLNLFFLLLFSQKGYAEIQTALWISKDFNPKPLYSQPLQLGGKTSVMRLLSEHVRVETSFGSAFVSRINGVPAKLSKTKQDGYWFYYVNGILADVGARSYELKPGDMVWWDFHEWSSQAFVPSVIGAYPQPFLSGYKGTALPSVIVAEEHLLTEAKALEQSLKGFGVKSIRTVSLTNDFKLDKNHYYILASPWSRLKNVEDVKSAYEGAGKTGFFLRFNENFQLKRLNAEESEPYKQGSAILALGAAFQTTPFWVLTGSSVEEVKKAFSLLIKQPRKLRHFAGALLIDDELTALP